MGRKMAVIGVGNMARAILAGIISSDASIDEFFIYDKNETACKEYKYNKKFNIVNNVLEAVNSADCVLLSVKPQNYSEVLDDIKKAEKFNEKLYISIAAGITSQSVSDTLGGAVVIRVLPNLPMTIGNGVSAICKNAKATKDDFDFVNSIFSYAGTTIIIDEIEMNRIIGVTSSSPAYVFKFIDSICKGADAQGLNGKELLDAVCDVVIGSALLLKQSSDTPSELISRVASKGGTTEQALNTLDNNRFDDIIKNAMIACTLRADELGK